MAYVPSSAYNLLGRMAYVPSSAYNFPGRMAYVPSSAYNFPGRMAYVPSSAYNFPGRMAYVPSSAYNHIGRMAYVPSSVHENHVLANAPHVPNIQKISNTDTDTDTNTNTLSNPNTHSLSFNIIYTPKSKIISHYKRSYPKAIVPRILLWLDSSSYNLYLSMDIISNSYWTWSMPRMLRNSCSFNKVWWSTKTINIGISFYKY